MKSEKLFLILLEHSFAAGWLVLAIIIMRPFLRRVSRSLCCMLWGLVAFRLLCPFSFESVFSLLPSLKIIPTNFESGQPLIWDTHFSTMGRQPEEMLGSSTSVIDTAVASRSQVLLQVVTWIWLAGFSLFILYAFITTLRLYIQVRDSVKQDDGYWLCDWVSSPFVLGVFRPRIIMPFNMDRRDIPYILAHERAHLERHDHWRQPIAFLLLAVFWFQPMLWIAYYLFRRDVEFACDECTIRMLGAGKECKIGYAKALLQNSTRRTYAAKLPGPLAFGNIQVKHRVSSVLRYRKPVASRMLAALLVCAVLAVCFLTDPKAEAGEFTDSSASDDTSQQASESIIEEQSRLSAKPSVELPEELPMETEDSELMWYISEIFQFFVEKQGYDPNYILEWSMKTPKIRYKRYSTKTKLIIDIDVEHYLKTREMVKLNEPIVVQTLSP